MRLAVALPAVLTLVMPQPALAQVVAAADSGDTGWMMACALLVMLAALPGLMLRYIGRVNGRNALSVAAQVGAVVIVASLMWVVIGYSLSFAPGSAWLGGSANLLLANLAQLREGLTVPESAFVLFQLCLALLAIALMVGAVAERTAIGWWMLFAPVWLLLVYAPVVHPVWGGGWLATWGVMDFAGGLVVHGVAGFSALALAMIVGPRRQRDGEGHAPALAMAGSAMLWIGLSGAVGGWALGATDDAATAILNHHLAACAGALGWAVAERMTTGRASASGMMSGAIAGMAAIAASAALAGTGGAIAAGFVVALLCRLIMPLLDRRVDDTGSVFIVHGLAGALGVLLLPVLVLPILGGVGFQAGITLPDALVSQAVGLVVVALWAMVGSAIAALMVSMIVPMRVDVQAEADGLDRAEHGQHGWDFR